MWLMFDLPPFIKIFKMLKHFDVKLNKCHPVIKLQ